MSICVKSGAVVELLPYGAYIICDLHTVGDIVILNYTGDFRYKEPKELPYVPSHRADVDKAYINRTKGIVVVKAYFVETITTPSNAPF